MFFYYLAIAFRVWMIVDAVRRRAEFYWFLIIVFLPFGDLLYFFIVKLRDFRGGAVALPAPRGITLPELRRLALEIPSFQNKLKLADALEDREEYVEGEALYRQILAREPDNKHALHGLSRCLLGSGRPAEACEKLAELMALDSGFRDFSAALDYAEALWQSHQGQDAVDLLRGLVSVSSRVNHRVALAHYLSLQSGPEAARAELETALLEYQHLPEFAKKRDRKWADRAQKMLRELRPGTRADAPSNG
ncbi:MAG TPA: tetratricopeptide repeat protein [Polyangiaceae bacterium]|nr:tetratricopeptide repeat protein [Polyangiaceae bacterium]